MTEPPASAWPFDWIDETRLWLWEYTDEFGKRRVSRWRMSEEQAAGYKDAEKVEGMPRDPASDVAVDQRLSAIAAQALAGHHVESAWELFRLQHFPGWEHQEIAAVLGVWSHRHGIELTFEGRTVRDLRVIWVCFSILR